MTKSANALTGPADLALWALAGDPSTRQITIIADAAAHVRLLKNSGLQVQANFDNRFSVGHLPIPLTIN
jgi:hypothetical protein